MQYVGTNVIELGLTTISAPNDLEELSSEYCSDFEVFKVKLKNFMGFGLNSRPIRIKNENGECSSIMPKTQYSFCYVKDNECDIEKDIFEGDDLPFKTYDSYEELYEIYKKHILELDIACHRRKHDITIIGITPYDMSINAELYSESLESVLKCLLDDATEDIADAINAVKKENLKNKQTNSGSRDIISLCIRLLSLTALLGAWITIKPYLLNTVKIIDMSASESTQNMLNDMSIKLLDWMGFILTIIFATAIILTMNMIMKKLLHNR